MTCEPQEIMAAAKCYDQCIPAGAQNGVQTYLLRAIAGYTGSVSDLMSAAKCIANCIPPGMLNEVKTQLLCEVVNDFGPPIPPEPPVVECTHALVDDPVTGWAQRVIDNGGAAVSESTRGAMCIFCNGLDAAGLTAEMLSVNCLVPDNLIAAITPLIIGPGLNPWTNNGFVAADLNLDGLKGDGLSKWLNTGVNPSTAYTDLINVGLSLYVMTGSSIAVQDIGCTRAGSAQLVQLISSYSDGRSYWDSWNFVGGRALALNAAWVGFLSGNRIAANDTKIYKANSANPFAQIGSAATAGGTRPNGPISLFGVDDGVGAPGALSSKRYSFAAIHYGLDATQCEDLFDLVQALRLRLGGGLI